MPYTIDTVEKGQINLTVTVFSGLFEKIPNQAPRYNKPFYTLIQKGVTCGELFPEYFNGDTLDYKSFVSRSTGFKLTLKDGKYIKPEGYNTPNLVRWGLYRPDGTMLNRLTGYASYIIKSEPPFSIDVTPNHRYNYGNSYNVIQAFNRILKAYNDYNNVIKGYSSDGTSFYSPLEWNNVSPNSITAKTVNFSNEDSYIANTSIRLGSINSLSVTPENNSYGVDPTYDFTVDFVNTYVNEPITTLKATFLSTGADSGNPPDAIDAPIDPDEGTATFTIPDAGSLVKASYALRKWKNKTTGEEYAIGAQCTINAPTDFEPVWVKTQYVAHFTKPADVTGTVPSDIYGTIQEDEGVAYINLPLATLVKTDFFFYGWALPSESGDQNEWIRPGTTITIDEDTTFVAVFSRYNPGYPGTPTTPTGGTGSLVEPDSPVVIPSDPGEVILEAENMISVFNPTSSELTALANAMFSSTVLDALKNIIASPIESVISLKVVPFAPSTTQNKYKWKIGLVSVAAPMKLVNDRYVDFNFGALEIKEVWGNFLDYSPNTSAEIFLPYIGYRSVNIDDIMGKTVSLKYKVDVTTGTTVAFLVDSSNNILYQWTGNCAIEVPLNSRDYSTFAGSLLGIATAAASMVATSGATAPAVIAAASSAVSAIPSVSGNTHAGSFDSSYGAISAKKAHFVIHRPKQIIAENGNTFYGYPSNITKRLGDMRGYTEVAYIHMEGFPATRDEIAQIEAMLKEGVIL